VEKNLEKIKSQIECSPITFLRLNQFESLEAQMKELDPLSVLRPK